MQSEQTSDLVGEQLSENFVRQALKDFAPFVLLPAGDRYVILTDHGVSVPAVEANLQTSHHYRLARELQQLNHVQNIVVRSVPEVLSSFNLKETCLLIDLPHAQNVLTQLRRQTAELTIQPPAFFQSPFQNQSSRLNPFAAE